MNRILCRHPYSYGECDLDLCPIVNSYYANVIFQEDGIYLIVKKPSEDYIAGEWEKTKLEISPELDNEEEVIKLALEKAEKTSEIIKRALQERIRRIYMRMRFLKEREKPIGILAPPTPPERVTTEEEMLEETLRRELEKIEAEETKPEEELEKELERIEMEEKEETKKEEKTEETKTEEETTELERELEKIE